MTRKSFLSTRRAFVLLAEHETENLSCELPLRASIALQCALISRFLRFQFGVAFLPGLPERGDCGRELAECSTLIVTFSHTLLVNRFLHPVEHRDEPVGFHDQICSAHTLRGTCRRIVNHRRVAMQLL